MDIVKGCWWCAHFSYSNQGEAISEVTPGYDFGIRCAKERWEFDPMTTTQDEFADIMESAESCPFFEINLPVVKEQPRVNVPNVEGRLATLEFIVKDIIKNGGKI